MNDTANNPDVSFTLYISARRLIQIYEFYNVSYCALLRVISKGSETKYTACYFGVRAVFLAFYGELAGNLGLQYPPYAQLP